MELNKEYKIVKEMLDNGFNCDVISEVTGLPESAILNFFNGEYQLIKTEEHMQELRDGLNPGERLVRSTPYDPYDELETKTR